jgi:hypothetical protein
MSTRRLTLVACRNAVRRGAGRTLATRISDRAAKNASELGSQPLAPVYPSHFHLSLGLRGPLSHTFVSILETDYQLLKPREYADEDC